MTDSVEIQALSSSPSTAQERVRLSLTALRRRLHILQWLAPLAMALVVILYEFGPARWLHNHLGSEHPFLAEILFFGTIGPVLVFLLLYLLSRWLEEKETSELQAQVLAQVQEQARISHEVTDDAVQALFAASVFLSSLESKIPDMPSEVAAQLRQTNQALDPIMQQLYAHLASRRDFPPRTSKE